MVEIFQTGAEPETAPAGEVLPEEISPEEERKAEEARLRQIAALTQTLIRKRQEAIDYRATCGIEDEWSECEDSYEGIDDANRGTEQSARVRVAKPTASGASATTTRSVGGTRSTVFLNITRHYVDAASARVADMLVPTDDKNFAFLPTPIPTLGRAGQVQAPQLPQAQVQAIEQTVEQLVERANAMAKERAEAAEKRVDDWLTECFYHGEMRKVIEDASRLGTGVLKGPMPVLRKRTKASKGPNGLLSLEIIEEIVPESKRVDPWDVFPDPSCGELISNGSYLFERDRMSARQLRDLKDQPGYNAEELDAVLEEGPSKINLTQDGRTTREDDRFEVWYYYGQISEDDLTAVLVDGESTAKHTGVVCTMINDRTVKTAPSHLDSGDIPFDMLPWQRRAGLPWGIGVAKQLNVPQRMLNAATRNMNDNAGLSNGPQIVMKKGVVSPANGVFELTPRKLWFVDPEKTTEEVQHAFRTFDIETRQPELMNIIEFSLKMAEDVTGLPMLMQGNQGNAPDTVGGMKILNTNANTVLRRIARMFDDRITRPHMRRYYEWIMLYGEENEKGDFTIDARGSTSLVERDIQQQTILGMGQYIKDPAFEADPKLWFQEVLRANKIDPKRIMLTEERKAEIAQQQQAEQQAMAQQAAAEDAAKAQSDQAEIAKDILIAREKNALESRKIGAMRR